MNPGNGIETQKIGIETKQTVLATMNPYQGLKLTKLTPMR